MLYVNVFPSCFQLNYTEEITMTIWIYPVVSGCQLVSPLLLMKLAFEMPWCTLQRFVPWNSVMYFTVPLVASWCIQIIFNPPNRTGGEVVSHWISPVTSIMIGMDSGISLDFICSVFKTHLYLACYRCYVSHFFK